MKEKRPRTFWAFDVLDARHAVDSFVLPPAVGPFVLYTLTFVYFALCILVETLLGE